MTFSFIVIFVTESEMLQSGFMDVIFINETYKLKNIINRLYCDSVSQFRNKTNIRVNLLQLTKMRRAISTQNSSEMIK